MNSRFSSVILVDDDFYTLESLCVLLRSRGMYVRGYTTGARALEGFSREPADLVVTDLTMPVMDGIRFLQELRRVDAQVPAIVMTGAARSDEALAALDLGIFDFVFKPFSPELFLNAVRNGLEHCRLMAVEQECRCCPQRTMREGNRLAAVPA